MCYHAQFFPSMLPKVANHWKNVMDVTYKGRISSLILYLKPQSYKGVTYFLHFRCGELEEIGRDMREWVGVGVSTLLGLGRDPQFAGRLLSGVALSIQNVTC